MSFEMQLLRADTKASLPNFQRDNWSTLFGLVVTW
jgi:hypothetical protein